jgi:hypothetical protein
MFLSSFLNPSRPLPSSTTSPQQQQHTPDPHSSRLFSNGLPIDHRRIARRLQRLRLRGINLASAARPFLIGAAPLDCRRTVSGAVEAETGPAHLSPVPFLPIKAQPLPTKLPIHDKARHSLPDPAVSPLFPVTRLPSQARGFLLSSLLPLLSVCSVCPCLPAIRSRHAIRLNLRPASVESSAICPFPTTARDRAIIASSARHRTRY